MSLTRTVPALVPSLFHNSRPWAPSLATRKRVPPTLEAVRELRRTYPDPYKAAAAVAEWIRASQNRHPFLRLLLRGLGKDEKDVEAVCAAVVLLMYGKDVAWTTANVGLDEKEEDLQDVFARATGWIGATTDRFRDVGPLVAETDVPAAFKRLRRARVFPVENWVDLLGGASPDELEQARLDSRAIAEDLRVVAEAAETVFGRGVFGLGVFRAFRGRRNGFHIRIGLVPMMVGFRRTMTPEEASNFADVAQALRGAVGPAKRIIALRKQFGVGRFRTT